MTALFIVLGIVLIIFLLTILPVTVDIDYSSEFFYRIKYAGIVLFDNRKRFKIKAKKRKKKKEKPKKEEPDLKGEKKENFFKTLCNEKGFFEAVKYCARFLGIILKKFMWLIKRFKFKKFKLEIIVASDDAANTALEYGGVCSAVYPIVSLLESNINLSLKSINISADFNKIKPEIKTSASVTTRLIFWIVALVAVFNEYLKLKRKESENNERKQH